jgi:SpoVK/Ycf46/Vps4 family AAA+-type ATPase
MAFQESKEYYAKVGKAWKRGYLLYGPPGTGKSTMIAAIANYLDYDVYDLELTAVKNNTELRKLFIETTGKSIIVIEDIDCSIDLTGKRLKAKKASADKESDDDNKPKIMSDPEKDEATKVTLSGLLNFIDGLWSACGGERIIIFTTNHKEKLDPALIRRGRMDKHIEMSYCCFGGFKVLAKNYLDIVGEHDMFGEIRQLLGETDMSPADVAENMMPMSKKKRDPRVCFLGLIEALKKAKEDAAAAKVKEEEEAEVKSAKEKEEEEVNKTKEKDKGKDKTSDDANEDMKKVDK